ncbi:hypothetical protein DFJ65_3462, partial [Calidifontibacter indicus]
ARTGVGAYAPVLAMFTIAPVPRTAIRAAIAAVSSVKAPTLRSTA